MSIAFKVPVRARQAATPEATPDIGVTNARGLDYATVFSPVSSEVDALLSIDENGKITMRTAKIEFGRQVSILARRSQALVSSQVQTKRSTTTTTTR